MQSRKGRILPVAFLAGAVAGALPVSARAEATLELSISCLDGPFDQNGEREVGEAVTYNLAGFPANTIASTLSVAVCGASGCDFPDFEDELGSTDQSGNLAGTMFPATRVFHEDTVTTVTVYGDANNNSAFDAGEVQASDTITVPCPQLTPQDLVDQLASHGALSTGEVDSLTAKLDAAAQRAAAGNARAAINQINAFINEVRAMVKSGRLTTEQGQALIDAANLAIADL